MSLISYLTRIHFAEHALDDALGTELSRLGSTRTVILTDDDSRTGDGLAPLEDALPQSCTRLVAELPATNCSAEKTEAILAHLKTQAAEERCDSLIAYGGRRALLLGRRLASKTALGLPLIAVPTTTADVGLPIGAALNRKDTATEAMPEAILCDPTLTYRLSKWQTAAFGFDALTRCIEAFLAPGYNPPADGIALEGIFRASRALGAAVADGLAPEHRREMMAAALNGALAGQKGFGGVEALSGAIKSESNAVMPHGQLHASLLPGVLTFNAPAAGERYGRIATAMGATPDTDPIRAVAELGAELGLPDRLDDLDLGPADMERISRRAASSLASQTNPRHATRADYLRLLSQIA